VKVQGVSQGFVFLFDSPFEREVQFFWDRKRREKLQQKKHVQASGRMSVLRPSFEKKVMGFPGTTLKRGDSL